MSKIEKPKRRKREANPVRVVRCPPTDDEILALEEAIDDGRKTAVNWVERRLLMEMIWVAPEPFRKTVIAELRRKVCDWLIRKDQAINRGEQESAEMWLNHHVEICALAIKMLK